MNVLAATSTDFLDIRKYKEYDEHKAFYVIDDKKSGLKAFIAIHRENPGVPSFGATRYWNYYSEDDAIEDALRLSRLMTYKSALAGLKCGGAKGVILANPKKNKEELLKAYIKFVNKLKGVFVTGTDVGLEQEDIIDLAKESKYIVGIQTNPTTYTAYGLLSSIRSALNCFYKTDKLKDRTIAIQGVGKVGGALLDLLYSESKQIFASDINAKTIDKIQKKYPKITCVDPKTIHAQEVDVFSPCALSHTVNTKNINDIKAKLIVGGANNQLESSQLGKILLKKKIVYVPDYLANAGGLISVFSEYYDKNPQPDVLMERIEEIRGRTTEILKESRRKNIPTIDVADSIVGNIVSKYEKGT